MSRSVFYIGATRRRHLGPLTRAAAVALAALWLGGCGTMAIPVAQLAATTVTPSPGHNTPLLAAAKVNEGVSPADWERVRRTIAGIAPAAAVSGIAWSNPDTGTTGTLTIAAAGDKGGVTCRGFATTISDLRGIRRYRGEACDRAGSWQIRAVIPDDATML